MRVNNLENANRHFTKRMGNFSVLEYDKDLSVSFYNAETEYFGAKMGVHRRQLVIDMNGTNTAVVQAGAMQWMAGNVVATSGIKGVGDFFGKAIRGAVTKESAVKPEYKGSGILVLEPTYMWSSGDPGLRSRTECSTRVTAQYAKILFPAAVFPQPRSATRDCSISAFPGTESRRLRATCRKMS